MPTTTNMSLVLPTEGGDADIWDTLLAAVFNLIDAHDHSSGKGVPVPSSGLRINADVPFNYSGTYYAATGVKAVDFQPSAAADVSSYAGALFVNSLDNELYFRTTSGSNVKVTSGTSLNVSAFTGGIGGDYSSVSALVSFSDADDAYLFQQQGSPRPWARMRSADVDIYEAAAGITNRVRLQSPAALAASYAITLPAALPASTLLMQMSSAGVLSLSNTLASGLTLGGALTLPGGSNINISGSGEVKHGDRQTAQDAASQACTAGTYSSGASSDCVSYTLSAAGVVYIPIRGLKIGDRLKVLRIVGTSVAEPAFAIYTQNAGVATARAHTSANTIVANGNITLSLDTPYTLALSSDQGDFVNLKVTAGANSFAVKTITAVYDRP